MILEALNALYYDLYKKGLVPEFGFANVKYKWIADISTEGELELLTPCDAEDIMPFRKQTTNGVSPLFLWDNVQYFFGTNKDGKLTEDRFNGSKELHQTLLSKCSSPLAQALYKFFDKWSPDYCQSNPIILDNINEVSNSKIVFRVNGEFVHKDEEIKSIWREYHKNNTGDAKKIICSVSGEPDFEERIHPTISRIAGSQGAGATLVSYNDECVNSYGFENGENAHIGRMTAFAYSTALNYLTSNYRLYGNRIGDTTIVSFARGGSSSYSSLFNALFKSNTSDAESLTEDIHHAIDNISHMRKCNFNEEEIDPNVEFYIFGIRPNSARLAVSFEYKNTFGRMMKNVNDFVDSLKINGAQNTPSVARIVQDALEKKKPDDYRKEPNDNKETYKDSLVRKLIDTVINGSKFPSVISNGVEYRIYRGGDVSSTQAQILKAIYTKNEDKKCPKEVLQMGLNENSTNVPYILGRLFSIYDYAQWKALGKVNSTIKDKYFRAAMSTPSRVFPTLQKMYGIYAKKFDSKFTDFTITELMSRLEETMPDRLNQQERASFCLGYYHQQYLRFANTKKSENSLDN